MGEACCNQGGERGRGQVSTHTPHSAAPPWAKPRQARAPEGFGGGAAQEAVRQVETVAHKPLSGLGLAGPAFSMGSACGVNPGER